MKIVRCLAVLFVMGMFVPTPSLRACPLCKDAISSPGDGEEEINNAPQAYNISIYLMVGVPYTLLGGVGFFIYRGCRKNAAYLEEGRLRPENQDGKMDDDDQSAGQTG